MASFTGFSFILGSVLSMLFWGSCFGQMSEMAETVQLLQGAMTKIEDLENLMKAEQDKMTTVMKYLFMSIRGGLMNKFASEMKVFHSELNRALKPNGDSKDAQLLEDMEDEVWNTYREIRKVKSLLQVHNKSCPEAWSSFGNSCYFFSSYIRNWTAARDHCREMGGDLVKISTDEEYEFLLGLVDGNSWIGLSEQGGEGIFKWSLDNSTYDSSSSKTWWHKDQPDNYKGDEGCIMIWFNPKGLKLNDVSCHSRFQYVCEMEPLTNGA